MNKRELFKRNVLFLAGAASAAGVITLAQTAYAARVPAGGGGVVAPGVVKVLANLLGSAEFPRAKGKVSYSQDARGTTLAVEVGAGVALANEKVDVYLAPAVLPAAAGTPVMTLTLDATGNAKLTMPVALLPADVRGHSVSVFAAGSGKLVVSGPMVG